MYFQTLWRFLRRFRYLSFKNTSWGPIWEPKQIKSNNLKRMLFLVILVVFSDSLALSASIPLFFVLKYPLGVDLGAKTKLSILRRCLKFAIFEFSNNPGSVFRLSGASCVDSAICRPQIPPGGRLWAKTKFKKQNLKTCLRSARRCCCCCCCCCFFRGSSWKHIFTPARLLQRKKPLKATTAIHIYYITSYKKATQSHEEPLDDRDYNPHQKATNGHYHPRIHS